MLYVYIYICVCVCVFVCMYVCVGFGVSGTLLILPFLGCFYLFFFTGTIVAPQPPSIVDIYA